MTRSISDILRASKTVAIIGLSDKPDRYSHSVAQYLQKKGYRVIPVNPNISRTLGEKAYPTMDAIPDTIIVDIVDIFRSSENVLPHIKESIKRKTVQLIWLQKGIINEEAKQTAEKAGIPMVMDACLMVHHKSHTNE